MRVPEALAEPSPRVPASGRPPAAYTRQAWTVRDGLPVNHVNQVYQTPDGYLWLATFDGLVRFDGVRFVVFNAANTPALPSNRIVTIQAGLGSSFWLNTEQDDLLHVEQGRFTRFGRDRRFHDAWVVADGDSALWVATEQGLLRHTDGRLVPFAADVLGGESIRQVLRSRSGALWVAVEAGGVWRFDRSGRRFFPTALAGTGGAHALFEDPGGGLWVGHTGVARLTPGGFKVALPGPAAQRRSAAPSVFGMRQDPGGELVLSTAAGLVRLGPSGGRPAGPAGTGEEGYVARVLGGAFTTCPDGEWWAVGGGNLVREGRLVFQTPSRGSTLFCDREGSLWMPSAGQGLWRYRAASVQAGPEAEGAPFANLYGIYEDRRGTLWFGARGQGAYHQSGGTFALLRPGLEPEGTTAAFYEEADGTLWAGRHRCRARTPDGGCAAFDVETALPPDVHAVLGTRDGALWFGTSEGAFRFAGGVWTRFAAEDGLRSRIVRFLLESRDGSLWMATSGGGIARYRPAGGGAHPFETITTADGLPSDNVRALYEDAAGTLWIATEDRGLARLDPRTGRIVTIREADGLYADGLHTALEDDDGRLWMSTNQGLFWVLRRDLDAFAQGEVARVRSTFYTEQDGMPSREANGGFQNAALKASDGRLWFATQGGAVVVDPRAVGPALLAPPAVIEDVTTTQGRGVPNEGAPVTLSATERSFAVRYTAPSFVAPERMRFRYRLGGLDADWVDAGGRREAIYTNVPPGTYVLSVASSTGGGVWNEEGAPLTLTLAPFFYETGWFRLLCALAAAGALGAAYGYRTRALRRRAADLQTVVEVRTRELRGEKERTEAQADQLRALDRAKSQFFADISHEFRTPLTLTLGPIQDALEADPGSLDARTRERLRLALRNGRRLHRLTNQLLDLARLEAGHFAVDLRPGDLADYLRSLAGPFAAAAERAGVAFRADVPEERVPVRFDPDHLDKVFGNLLSNAVKFTVRGGSVALTLRTDGGEAVVAVRDTGSGIHPEHLPHVFDRFFQGQKSEMQPGTGIGLALAQQIADLHGTRVEAASALGEGSTFSVRLPLDEAVGEEASQEPGLAAFGPSPGLPAQASEGDGALTGVEAAEEGGDDVTTVLVVDDNADIRAYLRSHLEGRYRVAEASDGEAALAAVRARLPDLVVSDVMMPRLDGFGLLAALRANPETDFLPVVLLTARAEAEDRLAGLGLGADDYVTKPFEARELLARVDNLIAQRRRLRERFAGGLPALSEGALPSPALAAEASALGEIQAAIEQGLSDEGFGVEALADALGQNRSTLYRRVHELTGASPSELVRRARVARGATLLRERAGTVSEVAYAVGFKSVSHFSASFRQLTGQTPTAYLAAQRRGGGGPR